MTPIQALIVEVRALATKYPDAVYKSNIENGPCWYTKMKPSNTDDTCGEGCIFGQAAKALPDDNPLKPLILSADNDENLEYCHVNLRKSPLVIRRVLLDTVGDCDELHWCRFVQHQQDAKAPWGEAVKFANKNWPKV